ILGASASVGEEQASSPGLRCRSLHRRTGRRTRSVQVSPSQKPEELRLEGSHAVRGKRRPSIPDRPDQGWLETGDLSEVCIPLFQVMFLVRRQVEVVEVLVAPDGRPVLFVDTGHGAHDRDPTVFGWWTFRVFGVVLDQIAIVVEENRPRKPSERREVFALL